jgi:hypothetical protein
LSLCSISTWCLPKGQLDFTIFHHHHHHLSSVQQLKSDVDSHEEWNCDFSHENGKGIRRDLFDLDPFEKRRQRLHTSP